MFLLVFLASLPTVKSEQTVILEKIGSEVVLTPPTSSSSPITSIVWKHNDDLAVEWLDGNIDVYRNFKGRSNLNITTGELTLKNLSADLSGDYVVEISGHILGGPTLKVLSPVPKPSIISSCNEEKTHCTLTCEGNVADLDPRPTYKWKFNATELTTPNNNYEITPEASAYEFICELENSVSRESSEPIKDPFYQESEGQTEGSGPKINTGIVVFASLLALVVGVALVHRVKSGMWFYQKDSMPWEADFWRKSDNQASSEPQPANEDTAERNTMIESNS